LPWKEELLDGLLGNDLLGFHLRTDCQNLLETVEIGIEALSPLRAAQVRLPRDRLKGSRLPVDLDQRLTTEDAEDTGVREEKSEPL
jgi:trehalose-6-phosphate synthase